MSVLVESINKAIKSPAVPVTVDRRLLLDVLGRLNSELISAQLSMMEKTANASALITEFYPLFSKSVYVLKNELNSIRINEAKFSSLVDNKTKSFLKKSISDNERIIKRMVETIGSIKDLPLFSKLTREDSNSLNVIVGRIRDSYIDLALEFTNDGFAAFKKNVSDSKKKVFGLVKAFEKITANERASFGYVSQKSVSDFFNDLIVEFEIVINLLGVYNSLRKGVLSCYESINSLIELIDSSILSNVTLKGMLSENFSPLLRQLRVTFPKARPTDSRGFMTGFSSKQSFDEAKVSKERLIKHFSDIRDSKSGRDFLDNLTIRINEVKPKKDFERILSKARKDLEVIDKWAVK